MGKLTGVLRLWSFLKSVSALLTQTSFTQEKATISEDKVMRIQVMQRRKQGEQSLLN